MKEGPRLRPGPIRVTFGGDGTPLTITEQPEGLWHFQWADDYPHSLHLEQFQDGEWRTISRITHTP